MTEINELISRLEPVVFAQSEDAPGHAKGLCLLGEFWSGRYDLTEDIGDLATAIRYTEQAVSNTREDDADLATRLIQFGKVVAKRYEQTRSINDFQAATSHIERALPFVCMDDPDRAKGFRTLGNLFSTRFEHMKHLADLDTAIEHTQTAFLLTPEDYLHRMDGQARIGDFLALRYERTGNLNDLNLAILSLGQGVSATSVNHPALANRLIGMGQLLVTRYDRLGDINDLDDAIRNEERAISVATQGNPNSITCSMARDYPILSIWLATLGGHLARRYDHVGRADDFDAANLRIHQAISMTAEDDTHYPVMLDYLGNLSLARHNKTGDIDDLESAIQYSTQVVSATSEDKPELAVRLGNIGSQLFSRYEITNNATDLDGAIDNTKKAILNTAGHPHPAAMLYNLAHMLLSRFQNTGRSVDVEEAIANSQRAVDLLPEDHPELPACLMARGNALSARYTRTGNTHDLDAAIFHIERAESIMTEVHPRHVMIIYSLSQFLSNRYGRTGEIADLNTAISLDQKVVDRTSEGNPKCAKYMNGLADDLFRRYTHSGNTDDLEKAITTIQRAMVLIPVGHPQSIVYLYNLARMLEARYQSTKNVDDLEEAISVARKVRSATPKENSNYADYECHLGKLLVTRISLIVNINSKADLVNTLQGLREAVRHPNEAIQLSPLAQDHLEALKSFTEAGQCLTATPRSRVRAAQAAVEGLRFFKMWDQASEIAQNAVKLLPLICGRHLNRKDQQYAIKETSGVAAMACSLSIKTGRVEQALQQVDFGRGLILGYLIDNKSDISVLKQADPSLADEFEELRSTASRPIPDAKPAIRQQAIEERAKAVQQFETCLERIRQIPGHQNFLKEPEVIELLKGAAEGPIVVVNITKVSSDAIIVTQSGLRSIELSEMSLERTSFLTEVFGRHSSMDEEGEDYDRDGQLVCEKAELTTIYSPNFLSQLWTSCVKPILNEISKQDPVPEKLPRIWWIGTGVASSLPFHAAGDYSQDATDENTLSQALPSYTPTIKALLHARSCLEKPATNQGLKASLLVVTMPETPGHTSLSGVTTEACAIEKAVGSVFTVKTLVKPSVESVSGEMGQSDIVHFACHGSSDSVDPSNRHLLLYRETGSGAGVGKLTLQQISDSQSAGKAMIAYLSACSTAEVKAGSFADEALHIVSAFQVVGFGHVIGSLWSVDDATSAEVAKLFYESLRGANGLITNRAVANALRGAVMSIRGDLSPLVWASYVHFGA